MFVICSVINEAFITAEKMYLLLSTSPLGVTLGMAEHAARLWTRVSHRTGLFFFETFELFKIPFSTDAFILYIRCFSFLIF
jgi:hypothetical protein